MWHGAAFWLGGRNCGQGSARTKEDWNRVEFLHRNNELIQLAQNCCVGIEESQERWSLGRT